MQHYVQNDTYDNEGRQRGNLGDLLQADYNRTQLKKRPVHKIEVVFDYIKNPHDDFVTPTSLYDFFTYKGADISEWSVVIFFSFYAKDQCHLTFKEFEYFLTFQRGYSNKRTTQYDPEEAKEQGSQFCRDDERSTNVSFLYSEAEDIIFELVLRELMLLDALHGLIVGLKLKGDLDESIVQMYKQIVPVVQIDLKEDDVAAFMRRYTNDEEIERNMVHVMARFDVTNDWVVSYSDFFTFVKRLSSNKKGMISEKDYLHTRVEGENKRSQDFGRSSTAKSNLVNGSLLYNTNNKGSRKPINTEKSKRSSAGRFADVSFYSREDQEREVNSLNELSVGGFGDSKKSFNGTFGSFYLENSCETDIQVLTNVEVKDMFRRYAKLLLDFERLNQIQSLKEEICLKEIYLMLLNLKNATYDRTLSPYKYRALFELLDINLTEE